MGSRARVALAALALALGAVGLAADHDHSSPTLPQAAASSATWDMPSPDIGADSLKARAAAEQVTLSQFRVPHDFRFTDRLPESGITFVGGIVDDAAKHYKMAHYDHGSGIAVADVDGDGRLDVYFVNQKGGNELWKNVGDGSFKDITAEAGVGLPGRFSVTATFADVDNDGDSDLYVTTVRGGNALFENDGKGHFRDVTAASGLGYVGHSSAAVFFDYDRDGQLDLFLVNVGKYTGDEKTDDGHYVAFVDAFLGHMFPERTEKSVLYKNRGHNHFADVSKEMKLEDGSWSGDASIADFNADGWPDLYVLNMQGDNHYYENQGGKSFVDATQKYFRQTPFGAMGIKSFDWNNDGLMDLLITDMHSDMRVDNIPPEREKLKFEPGKGQTLYGNAFFENHADGRFSERSSELNLENFWPWGVSTGDLNADGWEDVLITSSMNFPFRYGINSLLLNNAGERFLDSAFILGIEPRRGGRTRKPWFTLDCDGEDRLLAPCQGQTGKHVATGTLGTRSSAIFDLDDDGDLDIMTNDFNSEPQVFVSDLAQRHKIHWLKVKLVGKDSNRDGIGAVVKVKAGARTFTKLMDGNSGYLSHSLIPLYFGLAEAEHADGVEIQWPSGIRQSLPGPIAGNRQIEVVESGGGGLNRP